MNRHRGGQPAQIQFAEPEPQDDSDSGIEWVGYLLIVAILAASFIGIGYIAGRYFS